MPQHASIREHNFHFPCAKKSDGPRHGHGMEWFLRVVNMLNMCGFVIGSIWFLPGYSKELFETGDILFVACSFIVLIIALYHLAEEHKSRKVLQLMKDRSERNEFLENLLFAVSALIFFVGSILFWPDLYGDKTVRENESNAKHGEAWGAWLFITGSFGFVLACYFNALGMAASKKDMSPTGVKCHYIHVFGLACALIGSVLFVCGSFLYRPGYSNDCSSAPEPKTEGLTEEEEKFITCVSVTTSGTYMYIWGSVLFLIEAITATVVTYIQSVRDDEVASDSDVELAE